LARCGTGQEGETVSLILVSAWLVALLLNIIVYIYIYI